MKAKCIIQSSPRLALIPLKLTLRPLKLALKPLQLAL